MFTAVPRRYDMVNSVITWGLDRRWRRRAAAECLAGAPGRLLDLCCGTGDLAIEIARLAEGGAGIVGIDYSPPMLEMAARKVGLLTSGKPVSLVNGDAADLPFPDSHFEAVGISFAFRNLTYRNPRLADYLAEVRRVLRAGGRFVIVETSQPGSALVRKLYHMYLRYFVANIGYLISGNRGAYRYLAESATGFYPPDTLGKLLIDAGFSRVSFRPLCCGAVGIHVAVK